MLQIFSLIKMVKIVLNALKQPRTLKELVCLLELVYRFLQTNSVS